MNHDIAVAAYLEAGPALSESELAQRSGLSLTEVHVLVECGALSFRGAGFNLECLTVARRARRLREELALEDDAHALALVLRLRERIRELETELDAMRAQLWP
jgi:hypothetical protein